MKPLKPLKKFAVKPMAMTRAVASVSGAAAEPEFDPVEDFLDAYATIEATWGAPATDGFALDLPHWVCLVFHCRAQKMEFLAGLGLPTAFDKHQTGEAFAAKLRGEAIKAAPVRKRFAVTSLKKAEPVPDVEPVEVSDEETKEPSAIEQSYRSEHDAIHARNDASYWICLCYATDAERAAVAALLGDGAERFFDGPSVAAQMGVTLTVVAHPAMWKAMRRNARLLPLVRR